MARRGRALLTNTAWTGSLRPAGSGSTFGGPERGRSSGGRSAGTTRVAQTFYRSAALPTHFLRHSCAQTWKKKKTPSYDRVVQPRCRLKEKEKKKRQILAKGRQPVSSSSPASAPHQKVRRPPQGSGANLATALAPKTQNRRSFKRAKKPQWLLSLYVTVFIYFVSAVATREDVSKHRDARGLRTRSAVPPQLWGPRTVSRAL